MKLFLDQGVARRSALLLRDEGQEGLRGPEMARLLRVVLDGHQRALESGAMLTVRSGRVRVRALPVADRRKRP